jgi:hypothetical protein
MELMLEERAMTTGLTSRPFGGTKVALAPAAFAGMLGAALLAGGLLGVATKSEVDSLGAQAIAAVSAPATTVESRVQAAQIAAGRGPQVRDLGLGGSRVQPARHQADHIGLSERLFPVTTSHVIEHGPLR